jgi:hypothetical protein
MDLPLELVVTLNYWLNLLMTCPPNSQCPNDSLAVLYPKNGGTGRECGYVQFPPLDQDGMDPKQVAGIVLGAVSFVFALSFSIYRIKLHRQEKRFRKRFVQQIARNISIGPSPKCIPVEKLAEEVQHIGNSEGTITKGELLKWMLDVKLEFISDRDFDALWAAMDLDNRGEVNAIDFFVFLSACGSQFEEVYHEQLTMPKKERLKLAARRLSNINKMGEEGVRALQNRLERNTRSNRRLHHRTGNNFNNNSATIGGPLASEEFRNTTTPDGWDASAEFGCYDSYDDSDECVSVTRGSNTSTVDA